jgi:hypothetical protein
MRLADEQGHEQTLTFLSRDTHFSKRVWEYLEGGIRFQ